MNSSPSRADGSWLHNGCELSGAANLLRRGCTLRLRPLQRVVRQPVFTALASIPSGRPAISHFPDNTNPSDQIHQFCLMSKSIAVSSIVAVDLGVDVTDESACRPRTASAHPHRAPATSHPPHRMSPIPVTAPSLCPAGIVFSRSTKTARPAIQ